MLDMASEHSDIVSEFLITKSNEGREMRAIKVKEARRGVLRGVLGP